MRIYRIASKRKRYICKNATNMKKAGINTLLYLFVVICVVNCFVSCGKSSPNNGDNHDPIEDNTDYKATNEVKTVVLKSSSIGPYGNRDFSKTIVLLESFYYRLNLCRTGDDIYFIRFVRDDGWKVIDFSGGGRYALGNYLLDMGEVSAITDITSKEKTAYKDYGVAFEEFEAQRFSLGPKLGFAVRVAVDRTESEYQYVRFFVSDYKMSASGDTVESYTIQYQLF